MAVVTNEVGWGIVPVNDMARSYRDLLGRVNASFVDVADQALLVVAGRVLPLRPRRSVGARAVTASALEAMIATLPGPDVAAADAVLARAGSVLRPSGALARLDRVAVVAGRMAADRPTARRPSVGRGLRRATMAWPQPA